MKKLYYFYVALTLFVLGTAAFVLLMDRRVTTSYAASVEASQRGMARRASFERLKKLAEDVNAPGNDVFDDGAVDAQATRMEQAYESFEQAMRSERRRVVMVESAEHGTPMLKELAEVDAAMRVLIAEGRMIFPAMRERRTGDAGTEPTPSQRDRLKLGPTEFVAKGRITPEEFEHRVVRLLDSVIGDRPDERSHVA